MSPLFIYNSRHSESFLVGEKSSTQKSREILRCACLPARQAQNDRSFYSESFFSTILTLIIFLTFFLTTSADAQVNTDNDVEIVNSTFQTGVQKGLQTEPIGDVIIEMGKSFIGTDYESYTLEVDGDEQLVINLNGLDCITFMEYALVFSRNIKQGKTTFDDFKNELTLIRYRDGKINQYPSRLHYFSDWIYDNEKKGIVKDVTKEIGGEEIKFNLDFMSDHPQYYKHLKEHPEFIPVIKKQEEEISKRKYYFIPQDKIAEVESKIEDGDILAFTSTVKGLDVNHVGIAVRLDDGRIHILQAPSVGYQVEITKLPLAEYVKKIKKDSGVIVARVLEPAE